MAVYFFDTSALVKRYVEEPGSQAVIDAVGTGGNVVIADITRAEFVSAVTRLARQGGLSVAEQQTVREGFAAHLVHEYLVAAIQPRHITTACALIERHGLRAYDSVQLAVALSVRDRLGLPMEALTFSSADERLSAAARGEGLRVIEPLA